MKKHNTDKQILRGQEGKFVLVIELFLVFFDFYYFALTLERINNFSLIGALVKQSTTTTFKTNLLHLIFRSHPIVRIETNEQTKYNFNQNTPNKTIRNKNKDDRTSKT